MQVFDSHAHLIATDDDRYPPAPLSGKLREGDLDVRFPAEELIGLMDAVGVARAMAVQRAHVYGYDNSYVCDAAERFPDRLTAVVAIDACADGAASEIRHWIGDRRAAGVRFAAMGRHVETADFCASPAAARAWAAADEVGASICIHVFAEIRDKVLEGVLPLMDRHPAVRVVIDHVANAPLGSDGGVVFEDGLKRYVERPGGYLKFTTINARKIVAAGGSPSATLAEIARHCPPGRVMWGSDVAQTKGRYEEMVGFARNAAEGLDADARASFLTGAAETFYPAAAAA